MTHLLPAVCNGFTVTYNIVICYCTSSVYFVLLITYSTLCCLFD